MNQPIPGEAHVCQEHAKRLGELGRHIHGGNGELGVRAKVQILWRSQMWLMTLAGVIVGSLITLLCDLLLAR
jgi:hypothetical protein